MPTVRIPANTWTELTSANATTCTFQVKSAGAVEIASAVGAVPPVNPAALLDTLTYQQGQGEVGITVVNLAPGRVGANRVYAYSAGNAADIYFSAA